MHSEGRQHDNRQGDGEVRFRITEIRVKLTDDPRNKLKAYCSVTIDDAFVVRDLKIIDGVKGPFVAMPSRKLADHCQRCRHKNHLRAGYCNQCGGKLDPDRAPKDDRGRARLHADLAHPINAATRIELHKAVVRAYAEEAEAAQFGTVGLGDGHGDRGAGVDIGDGIMPVAFHHAGMCVGHAPDRADGIVGAGDGEDRAGGRGFGFDV